MSRGSVRAYGEMSEVHAYWRGAAFGGGWSHCGYRCALMDELYSGGRGLMHQSKQLIHADGTPRMLVDQLFCVVGLDKRVR